MSCGVEVDADIVLRLIFSEGCARCGGVRPGAGEIVDAYFEVHHHLLVSGASGPGRAGVGRLGLERQPHSAAGWLEQDPVRFLGLDFPAE
jgi:hypothetical protein